MSTAKLKGLIIICLLMSSAVVLMAQPQSFIVTYKYTDPNSSGFRMIKYFLSEGLKFRSEYYSTVQFSISANAQGKVEDTTISGNANAELRDESAEANFQPHTIEILRNDKKLVWSMDPSFKNYFEVPLSQDGWNHATEKFSIPDSVKLKKTGESKILDYPCSIYEITQKVADDVWTNIYYVAKDLNFILKNEMMQNGKLVQTMEASEFSTNKPDDSLFEVPQDYKKVENSPQGE